MNIKDEFLSLRRAFIDAEFADLNPAQREAVYHINGPELVLAGAGTGKTTVVTRRISFMVKYGDAYRSNEVRGTVTPELIEELKEYQSGTVLEPSDALIDAMQVNAVAPNEILAITFTNKAANEMKERLGKVLGDEVSSLLAVSTFHSFCARQLRQYAMLLGYSIRFTIYDEDDSASLMRDIMRETMEDKSITKKDALCVLQTISQWKDEMVSPEKAKQMSNSDACIVENAKLYKMYQEKLKKVNAMDFDDLVYNMVRLLQQSPETASRLREKYPYIMVDEYQDTSAAQFMLVFLLSRQPAPNLCVVGDDDQSIYSFRGADVTNILNFPAIFQNTHLVRLEENYRSSGNILMGANSMICGAKRRMGKTLRPNQNAGEKIQYITYPDNYAEAESVADKIKQMIQTGIAPRDIAVLFRGNRQSLILQGCLMQRRIPFRVVGNTPLFERKEIKDILAYMTLIINPDDDGRLKRIINSPARKIGPVTVAALEKIAAAHDTSMMRVVRALDEYPELKKQKKALGKFGNIMENICGSASAGNLQQLLTVVLQYSGYQALLKESDDPAMLEELFDQLRISIAEYEKATGDQATVEGFLEQAALVAQADEETTENRVLLMTIHKSKGLEFNTVFTIGLVDGIFPSARAKETVAGMDEERRVFYVAMTRAKKRLFLSTFQNIRTGYVPSAEKGDGTLKPSPFLLDITPEVLEKRNAERILSTRSNYDKKNLWRLNR